MRHPAYYTGGTGTLNININTKDNNLGFDRSDHFLRVQNVWVTDSTGASASPNPIRDFDYANQAYAQLGISVINAGNFSATYGNVTFPVSNAEQALIRAANRAADPVVNSYHVTRFDSAMLFGSTASPEDSADHGYTSSPSLHRARATTRGDTSSATSSLTRTAGRAACMRRGATS